MLKTQKKIFIVKSTKMKLVQLLMPLKNIQNGQLITHINDNKTTMSFKPYTKPNGVEAWSFGVIKNSALKFGIGIEKGEARTLKTLLELYLTKLF